MDRTIKIPKKNIEEMISHARQTYPQECCGLLAGTSHTASDTYRMTNIDQSPFSYLMEPKEQFVALKDMREKGIEMMAIYHSHPKTDAEPSITDIKLAYYPDAYYIILSLAEPMRPDIRAHRIIDGKAKEVGIEIV